MVRNSLDHGIERPEERRAAGKPETGRIRLQAWHEGGHIVLRIADDGRGLSIAKIREKIVKNGLASAAEVEQMRSEEHTSELQSLMRISSAVFCLKKKIK